MKRHLNDFAKHARPSTHAGAHRKAVHRALDDGARRALLGELLARAVDVGAVELVVAPDVEDVPGRGPCLGDVAHRACADRSPIACAHEHVGAFDDRGQEVVELEMQVGDDLNAHRAPRSQECWRVRILHLRAVFGECLRKVFT